MRYLREMGAYTLAMTRSIGDFYMHTYGVTWKPEVRSIDLAALDDKLEHLTLILASDGVWDLWETREVFRAIVAPPRAGTQSLRTARAFFDASLAKGAEIFGASADNMTGIVVYLNPKGVAVEVDAPPAPAAATLEDDDDCGC